MTTLITAPAPSIRSLRWDLTVLEPHLGCTRVRRGPGGLSVSLHDADPREDRRRPGAAFASVLAASCHDDGTVVVHSHCAPPALLVSASGTRMLPTTPGVRESASMKPGDRLLLLSASVMDQLPAALVPLLHGPPAHLLDPSPERLLQQIFGGDQPGVGALIVRTAQPARSDLADR